jgi:hypothetical protein
MKLTDRQVHALRAPGAYGDGGGLYLKVGEGAKKSWVFRYRFEGRRPEMGLGAASEVSLSRARQRRDRAVDWLRRGLDPIEERRIEQRSLASLLDKRVKLDRATTPGLTHLYKYYDGNGMLLYVGVAREAVARLNQHSRKSWFDLVAAITIDDFPTRKEAEAAETEVILTERPRFNRVVRLV